MSRVAKSQWDFGELFGPAALRRVYSVTELTGVVRRMIEKELGTVWVAGEVSNLREQSSGHIYFSLKDAGAQLQCVCFRNEARASRHLLKDGQKVLLQGDLTVYEARGQYQLVVRAVEAQGVGALQLAFERLKQQLQGEGLFAPERKRPLPRFPQRIGLVTSPTAAALRDVLHVVRRRQPGLQMVLAPCRVQGQGAAEEISAAIKLLNEWAATGQRLDLILVTRGGGSLEDLWAFNEEVVARAIFHSQAPVVSAVGHEIDFTISDFVADLRAATPSAAAEVITEGFFSSRQIVSENVTGLRRLARQRLDDAMEACGRLERRLGRFQPRRYLDERRQRLDDAQTALVRAARQAWRMEQTGWEAGSQRLRALRPRQALLRRREQLEQAWRRLREAANQGLQACRERQIRAATRLDLLSPLSVLRRGYSITRDAENGQVIRDAKQVRGGQTIKTRLHAGEIRSVVEKASPSPEPPG